ncbi:hypothetical protein MTR67_012596 [Solanum verrucosum]|uniref:Uncharacterized protein n=1 Tax=Solanum verrucosum TaxID=315347 RepID=A0AAF0QES7_SOLVR|nr:hypothetical protein MTR67_012596 [Solanum verrucosum]
MIGAPICLGSNSYASENLDLDLKNRATPPARPSTMEPPKVRRSSSRSWSASIALLALWIGSLGILFVMSYPGCTLGRDKLGIQSISAFQDMPPRRANVIRNVGNYVDPEVPQVSVDPLAEQLSHAKFQATFQVLFQAITTQAK